MPFITCSVSVNSQTQTHECFISSSDCAWQREHRMAWSFAFAFISTVLPRLSYLFYFIVYVRMYLFINFMLLYILFLIVIIVFVLN